MKTPTSSVAAAFLVVFLSLVLCGLACKQDISTSVEREAAAMAEFQATAKKARVEYEEAIAKPKSRNWEECERCERVINWDQMHWTMFNPKTTESFVPLCENCWSNMPVADRLVFYRVRFLRRTNTYNVGDWLMIEQAVKEGR